MPFNRKEWEKANTELISVRLQKSTDADILSYLDGKSKQGEIKSALRERIKRRESTERRRKMKTIYDDNISVEEFVANLYDNCPEPNTPMTLKQAAEDMREWRRTCEIPRGLTVRTYYEEWNRLYRKYVEINAE